MRGLERNDANVTDLHRVHLSAERLLCLGVLAIVQRMPVYELQGDFVAVLGP